MCQAISLAVFHLLITGLDGLDGLGMFGAFCAQAAPRAREQRHSPRPHKHSRNQNCVTQ